MKKKHFEISPSILSADFANLQKEVEAVTQAGADYLHVDVMDGHFVPNLTIGAPVVAALKRVSKIPLDCHLMITNPEKYISDFAQAGAEIITVHYELSQDSSEQNAKTLASLIKAHGCRAGLSIKPKTPAQEIFHLLGLFDLILVMSVEPGFSGQKFIPECALKLGELKREIDRQGLSCLLEIDGGINEETAKACGDADILVAGHMVFRSPSYTEAIQKLKAAKLTS